jgi:3-phosphoshikimate 1-carboxyvinyltransferase
MTGMTDLVIKQSKTLNGTVKAPPSKSFTHRAIIAASLSEGRSTIKNALFCDDTLATIEACRLLGARIVQNKQGTIEIYGCSKPSTPDDVINCRDSASTMRFLTPVCALADGISVLTGEEGLRQRPMEPILTALMQLGVLCYSAKGDGHPPFVVFGGGIAGGEVFIRGDVSSQFVSGLLFATPLGKKDTDIAMLTSLESKPYVEMTIDILKKHGLRFEIQPEYDRFHVPSQQTYSPSDHIIEGDFSSAAFLMAAATVTNSDVRILNLRSDSVQGDRVIVNLLQEIGVQIKVGKDFVEVQGVKNELKPINVDLIDNPDLIPVMAVVSCFAFGKSFIHGVKRLRFKESDRVSALLGELTKMGAKIKSTKDAIKVNGVKSLRGAELDSHGDHRIAMACVVAGLKAAGTTIVKGVECINKSYPDFVRDIVSLGAEVDERKLNR